MTPPMYKRVLNYLTDAGLTAGFTTQLLLWSDTGNQADKFMVFRPNGGGSIKNQLGADYYVMVDVIGAKGGNAIADERVNAIIDYVQQNPMADACVGYLENLGGIPAPVQTTEGRLVYRLQFVATFGS